MNQMLITCSAVLLSLSGLTAQENSGFGSYRPGSAGSCLTAEERSAIQQQIRHGIARLKRRGIRMDATTQVLLDWPLRAAASLHDYGYHGIANFVDHNLNYPDQLQDYLCGDRTYDLNSGYNHRGTDFFLWPFPWNKMDANQVEVVAAAPGIIVHRQDGNFDRNCGFDNAGPWNAIYVQHFDGSIAWYGHLKRASLTTKSFGDTVQTGEYLGVVGSSGRSTLPHLHFELYDANNVLVDPYAGPCNTWTSTSWWREQRPYYDSAVNKVMTHASPPQFTSCPNPDVIHEQNVFAPGDRVTFAAYYRDQLQSQQSRYTVFWPDGTVFRTWTHSSSVIHYAASYWYWGYTLPEDAVPGTWLFEVAYEGQLYTHEFEVAENTAPLAFHLITPENNHVVQSLRRPIVFRWQSAFDWHGDELFYSLTLQGSETDTVIAGLRDTVLAFSGATFLTENKTYLWSVDVTDGEFTVASQDTFRFMTPLVSSVGTGPITQINLVRLHQNHPNPFNPVTRIQYELPAAAHVVIRIFNLLGQEVATLVNRVEPPGMKSVIWDGKNEKGMDVNSGIYVYQLQAGGKTATRKMVLIR